MKQRFKSHTPWAEAGLSYKKNTIFTNEQYHLPILRTRKVRVLGELPIELQVTCYWRPRRQVRLPVQGGFWVLKYTQASVQCAEVLASMWPSSSPSLWPSDGGEERVLPSSVLQHLQTPVTRPLRIAKCRCDFTLFSWVNGGRARRSYWNLGVRREPPSSGKLRKVQRVWRK